MEREVEGLAKLNRAAARGPRYVVVEGLVELEAEHDALYFGRPLHSRKRLVEAESEGDLFVGLLLLLVSLLLCLMSEVFSLTL